jgi:hypothetical protein
MRELRIPTSFYHDHYERDLPTPPVIRHAGHHAIIDGDHPAVADLREDALYYSGKDSTDAPTWLKQAARYLLDALTR